ncbi:MAG: aminopeptidase P family protein [Candidatus Lustribacter sp.]|jgi:Xaa-Pro aminopeptidase
MYEPPKTAAHDSGTPAELLAFMTRSWAAPQGPIPTLAGRERFAARRRAIAEQFPGEVLIVPTGREKVRANDTNYRFRPGTDFYYLTGIHEPDCVLVIVPEGDGHRAIVFTEPNPGKTDTTFFTDRTKGELWVGPRLGVAATAARFGVETQPIDDLRTFLSISVGHLPARLLRGLDDDAANTVTGVENDNAFATALSELRLIKDELEIAELRAAIAATKRGFDDVVRALPNARTERVVEGVFNLRARVEGNDVGYSTIAASGPDACILHWVRNNRRIEMWDLLLLDAGVEGVSLYTADVTRTLPVSGTFTPAQREVYTLVWEAQRAAFEACKPGNDFLDPNTAAMRVLAHGLERLGILSSAEEALRDDKLFYKRYSLHNVSHMLGLDVHDCAKARAETYKFGRLSPGMVLTVEPGLYFQLDDLTVPERYRGIGVRIEDDVVITADGYENLSAALPSEPDAVEAWVRSMSGTAPEPWVIPAEQ